MKTKLVGNRFEVIRRYIENKKVLDLGCVDHDVIREKKDAWLHKNIKKYASYVLGVDLDKRGIKELKKKGYNVICDNVENMNLKKKFDVIITGDLIEHVSNQGIFLENIKKHLKKQGYLIISTPNSNNFFNFIEVCLFGKVRVNPEHTLWHSHSTLEQLLLRHNFKILESYNLLSNKSHFYDKTYKKIIINIRYFVHKFIVFFRKDFSSDLLIVCSVK